jgi:hypothetical protein
MNNEYVIINKTDLLKRIEELEKELTYHNEWYEKAKENYDRDEMRVASDGVIETSQEIRILKDVLSKSSPLIPEIEKVFNAGYIRGYDVGHGDARSHPLVLTIAKHIHKDRQNYISNLKLDSGFDFKSHHANL